MLPTIEEYNQSTASDYEKRFFRLCVDHKIHDWTNRHGLGGFKASIPIGGDRLPPDLKVDIIYEEKEEDD